MNFKHAAGEGNCGRHRKILDPDDLKPVEFEHPEAHDGQGGDREPDHGHCGGSLVDQGPGELGILQVVEAPQMAGPIGGVNSAWDLKDALKI